MTKIYTRTGDFCETALFDGTRVSKNDVRIDLLGQIDELNSWLGLVKDTQHEEDIKEFLGTVQTNLFNIAANIAGFKQESKFTAIEIESFIDKLELKLPPIKNFIYPGGHQHVSFCHLARSICRRVERVLVNYSVDNSSVDPKYLSYANRLSDALFVLARYTGKNLGIEERYFI